MDPVTATALAVKAIAEMVTEIVKGQTPEFRAKVYEWYVTDVEKVRALLKLDA